MFLGQAKF